MKYLLLSLLIASPVMAQFNDSLPPGYEDLSKSYVEQEKALVWQDLAESKADQNRAETRLLDSITAEKLDSQRKYKGDFSPELNLLGQQTIRNMNRPKRSW